MYRVYTLAFAGTGVELGCFLGRVHNTTGRVHNTTGGEYTTQLEEYTTQLVYNKFCHISWILIHFRLSQLMILSLYSIHTSQSGKLCCV
jgi:hypothetical protein